MKRLLLLTFATMLAAAGMAQCIARVAPYNGGKLTVTSSEKLFSGCEMSLCRYVDAQNKTIYAIELDLTDRGEHACEGNLFTVHFKDGSRISMTNMFDAKAEIDHDSYISTQTHTYTDFVPVYDGWYDAIYSVPVSGTYVENMPVNRTTAYLTLFYIISKQDIQKIAKVNVSQVSIVTDGETIVKKARGISRSIAALYEVLK